METQSFDPKIPGWLSEKEMQRVTGFKTTKLWELRTKGKLEYSKIGKRVFYRLDSFVQLLENNEIR